MILEIFKKYSQEAQTIATKATVNKRFLVILITGISAFFILAMIIFGFLWYRTSPQYAVRELESAIQTHNYKKFEQIMPKFSDGQKMTQTAFETFSVSMTKENENDIEKLLKNESNFKEVKTFLAPMKFIPKARYVKVVTDKEDTTLAFSSKKTFLSLVKDGDKLGPFIPSSYKLDYSVDSKMYGELKETKKFDLREDNQDLEIDETGLFLNDSNFQRSLLSDYVNYVKSEIACINDGMNFTKLKGVTDEVKNSYAKYYQELKSGLVSYKETFSQAIMNADSLKVVMSDDKSLEFDIYSDDAVSVITTEKKEIKDMDPHGTVTLTYDEARDNWLISDVEYGTFTGKPSDWEHTHSQKLNPVLKGIWTADQPDKENSI